MAKKWPFINNHILKVLLIATYPHELHTHIDVPNECRFLYLIFLEALHELRFHAHNIWLGME